VLLNVLERLLNVLTLFPFSQLKMLITFHQEDCEFFLNIIFFLKKGSIYIIVYLIELLILYIYVFKIKKVEPKLYSATVY